MNILFFGDITGKIGRQAIIKSLPDLKKEFRPDLVLANGENLAHGLGLTLKTTKEVLDAGIDYLTTGNHFFSRKEGVTEVIKEKLPVIRPANYPISCPGQEQAEIIKNKQKILLFNLLGRLFIESKKLILSDPFSKAEEILRNFEIKIKIVDFHAEATSEKQMMGYYLDGRVSLVVGTHTHVQTADEKILSGGTAYITDLGMVGAKDAVLGVEKESAFDYLFKRKEKIKLVIPKKGLAVVQGVFVKIDEQTGQAEKIVRINREIMID